MPNVLITSPLKGKGMLTKANCWNLELSLKVRLKQLIRGAWVAQQFSAALSPGPDPGNLGSSPTSGSLHGAGFPLGLCLCLSLSLCVSLINK